MPKVEVTNTEPDGSTAKRLLGEFDRLMQRVERRAYELFDQRGRKDGADLDDWFRAEQELLSPAKVETKEEPGRYTIRWSVPGFTGRDLKVYTLGDRLIVKSTVTEKSEAQALSTEESQSIFHQLRLPTGTDFDDITAEFKQEGLTINIPIKAQPKPVKVETSESSGKQLQATGAVVCSHAPKCPSNLASVS